jgi:hypothetical protein
MGEQKAPLRDLPAPPPRRERDWERDSRQRLVRRTIRVERCESGKRRRNPVPEHLGDPEACAVGTGLRNRKASRGEHDPSGGDFAASGKRHAAAVGRDPGHPSTGSNPHAATQRLRDEPVANRARLVGGREELSRLRLLDQASCKVLFEEPPDLLQPPRAQDGAADPGRGRNEPLRLEPGRKNVAAPAAGNQDLLAGIVRGFEQLDGAARSACEDRGKESRGSRPDDDDGAAGSGRRIYRRPGLPAATRAAGAGRRGGVGFADGGAGCPFSCHSFQITTIGAAT